MTDGKVDCLSKEDNVYFQQNEKGEGQGKEKCHAKSMMSNEANGRLKRYTQHVRGACSFFFVFKGESKNKNVGEQEGGECFANEWNPAA